MALGGPANTLMPGLTVHYVPEENWSELDPAGQELGANVVKITDEITGECVIELTLSNGQRILRPNALPDVVEEANPGFYHLFDNCPNFG